VTQSFLSGTCAFVIPTSVSVASMKASFWPAQLAIAPPPTALTLRHMKEGATLFGDAYLSGYGGMPNLPTTSLRNSRSEEMAAVYTAMYSAFRAIGGRVSG